MSDSTGSRRREDSRRGRLAAVPARLLAPRLRARTSPGSPAMVAYNLVLALFPFALLVLFVFGQVLQSPDVEDSVLTRPPAPLPGGRAEHPPEHPRPHPRQLDHDRRRRRDRRDLDRHLVLGRDGHRLLPHLPRRVPRLAGAEALRAGDAARSSPCSWPPASSIPPLEGAARLQRRRPPVRPLRRSAALDNVLLLAAALLGHLPALLRDLLLRAQGPRALARASGPGRCSSPSRRASRTPSSPSTWRRSRASARSAGRSASSSSPWSGSTSSAWR